MLRGQVGEVAVAEPVEGVAGGGNPPALEATLDEEPVGAAAHRHLGEGVGHAEGVLEGAIHRPLAGAAGEDERAVDVEEHQACRSVTPTARRGRRWRAARSTSIPR